MKYYVYILYNDFFDKFYIGQTSNLLKRVNEHNEKVAGYTSKYSGEWKLIHKEVFKNRAVAVQRERFLKKQKNKNFYRSLCN